MANWIGKMKIRTQILITFTFLAVLVCGLAVAGFRIAGLPFDSPVLLATSGILLLIILMTGLSAAFRISREIGRIATAANHMAEGKAGLDCGADTSFENKNEINGILCLFQKMSENVQDGALTAIRLAEGNFTDTVSIHSEGDLLAISLGKTQTTLNDLLAEITLMAEKTKNGDPDNLGNPERFKGGYRLIIEQTNRIIHEILAPLMATAAVINKMKHCDLQSRVTENFNGMNNQMKDALNETLDSLNDYIGEINSVMNELARFNLTVQIKRDYKGDFVQMRDAINQITQTFNQLLTEINKSADQVEAGSNQVSNGSQSLSSGSTEQAASIQQLMASVAQIADQIRRNAADATKAGDLAECGREAAVLGSRHMEDLQKAMSAINESSANISKIIKVIEDIAFQTNILALNAAVEAARAGQHGKGFAVVAEEVRNLAARSANAVKETSDLIEDSISRSDAGARLAAETSRVFNQVVEGISSSSNYLIQIARATNEQASAIAQIDQGIQQVSNVVQANSATAEQSAASSHELSAQAGHLRGLVKRFKLS